MKNRIRNIDIGKAYDHNYADSDIHYERLEKLADFFGRNMPVHYHDRFYQIHIILNGTIRVHLDENSYVIDGPMFFLTPPTVHHSFVIENETRGHVITARQNIVWHLLGGLKQKNWQSGRFLEKPLCVKLMPRSDGVAARLLNIFNLVSEESQFKDVHHNRAVKAQLQLILVYIARLSGLGESRQKTGKEHVRIFHQFNALVEENYKQHTMLKFDADKICITEARLNEICRKLAGLSSKQLITERLMQEARRLLHFSSISAAEIGYELGFKDPSYFARFFRRNAGVTAGQYRVNNSTM